MAKDLLDKGLTLVGTLCSNKRDVLPEMMQNKKGRIGTCMYFYDNDSMLASWVPYKVTNLKSVLLLSTMHSVPSVQNRKPEVVHSYNKTKVGVDVFDQMSAKYCWSRKTQRSPM